jgi:hypothetical protein
MKLKEKIIFENKNKNPKIFCAKVRNILEPIL